ncbi:MAG: BREX-1 system adenine-specific DNA-methyltransferase PglX [Methanobacterium sp.]
MDKKVIKLFAIESRKKLIEEVKYQASLLGITAKCIAEPVEKAEGIEVYDIGASNPNTIYDEAIKQRKNLVKRINENGFDNVVEEVAYTWFNRIIAIRFMEVNDYLPTRVRVLSSETEGKIEPDIVTEAPHIDLNFTQKEIEQIYQLKNDNKLDELFRLLFIKQCNKLNEILPELFEKTADYTELLLFISFTNEEGVVRQLIDNISQEDFTDQVEIIGWLYQYYITDLNDLVYDGSYKKKKIPKELLPAATQLFTPDWPVKYMVENSLGRLWLETHHNDDIKNNWKYYLDNNGLVSRNSKKLDPKSITVFDPCMGSGHILSYAFDVLMSIYKSSGYNERDAAILILENNIYGVDIDDRAYQLAYFSLLMKARKYNRKILQNKIKINLCSIIESDNISNELLNQIINDNLIKKDFEYLINIFKSAKEYGSILNVSSLNFEKLYDYLIYLDNSKFSGTLYGMFYLKNTLKLLYLLIKQAELLSGEYDVVFTNPPYLNSARFNVKLSEYVKKNFPDTKTDLATVFYQKSIQDFCKENGYISFITITSWMFLKKFEKFREYVVKNIQFESLVDFGTELFEGKIGHNPIISWVNKKTSPSYEFTAIKLSEYNYSRRYEKESEFFNASNKYIINQKNFSIVPGSPIAYWISENFINAFKTGEDINNYVDVLSGIVTGNTEKFLRKWYEVSLEKFAFDEEEMLNIDLKQNYWIPHNKGGAFKKWYGNQEYVVNWENGPNDKHRGKKNFQHYYLREHVSWSLLTSGTLSTRYFPKGFLWDVAGPGIFEKSNSMFYLQGLIASKVGIKFLEIINPTLNFPVESIVKIPLIMNNEKKPIIDSLVIENISIAKNNWDNFETSWKFNKHVLLKMVDNSLDKNCIERSFKKWSEISENQFNKLKLNEEKLNSIFIELYTLNKDINHKMSDDDITLEKADLKREIRSFISYSVGCMLGRYSLDEEGLIFAGGEWDPSRYSKFIPDDDNIIPILDTEYFEDDIVGRFVEFVKVAFGEDTLEENLDFIAQALKKKGNTSREVIRNYFLTDFYKDHVKTYKKHPIYWLFDSGRNNGFKALIYMHRYEGDLVARVRTDYLHKTQKALETAIAHNDRIIETSTSASEKSKAVKAKNKLVKQLEETKKYDEALAHVANQKIEIDLDDGVKVNYAKFQGIEVSIEGKKAKKIDLLKKI